jgi:hypothetical protein
MRRSLWSCLSLPFAILFLSLPAKAEAWRVLAEDGSTSILVYDADFTFIDSASGKVMAVYARALRDQMALPQSSWSGNGPAIIEAIDCARKLRSYAGLNFGKGADWQANWRATIATAPDDEAPEKLMEAVCAQENLASRNAGG